MTGRSVLPPDQYVASLARKRMAATAFFRDEQGRVLLVNPVYKEPWDLPGAIQMGEASRAEPGCNEYGFTQDLADPRVLVLMEEWASEEALQAHMATPSFAAFAELLARVIAAPPDFRRFDAQDARPLFG